MERRPVAVYDANVLYPAQLRDFLMRLAVNGVVRAHWSPDIHDEWIRNVHADHPDIGWEELEHTRQLMDQALPDACVRGFHHRIEALSLPDPADRHVLAVAIHIGTDVIVSFNTRDFPSARLESHDLIAMRPDPFVCGLIDDVPDRVRAVAREHRAALRKPPMAVEEYLASLRRGRLAEAAERLEAYRDQL